jgi:hypothetical protein
MAEFYVKKNTENSLELFNKRKIYQIELLKYNKPYIVNFFRGEKILYGRISRRFEPVTVDLGQLSPLPGSEGAAPLQAVNFVRDVFAQLCVQFKKCAAAGTIDNTDPYLTNLKAYKAYTSPSVLYETYRDIYYNSIASLFQENKIQVRTFEDFIKALMPLLSDPLRTDPLTYPGFVKSTNCSVMSTGLAIEIADLKYYDDQKKISSLIDSRNWEFFVNACNDYGFMVDLNIPWRIVADLNSDLMKQQAAAYGHVSFIETGFDSAFVIYIKNFVGELLRLYDRVRLPYYMETEVCKDGTVKQRKVIPFTYTTADLQNKHSAKYYLNLYLRMRLHEEQPQLANEEVEVIVRDYLAAVMAQRSLSAITHGFESAVNKTFDKSGSLGYIIKQIRAQTDAAFARGDITNTTVNFTGETEVEGEDDFSSY